MIPAFKSLPLQLQEIAMAPQKEVRQVVVDMYKSGYIQLQVCHVDAFGGACLILNENENPSNKLFWAE